MHALTLLNDLNMLASARALAQRVVATDTDMGTQLDMMCVAVVSRPPTPRERDVLQRELLRAQAYYRKKPRQAVALLDFGQAEQRSVERPGEVAAYLLVASMIYNLDEAMTHE